MTAPNRVGVTLNDLTLACNADYWYKPHGWSNIFKEKGRLADSGEQTVQKCYATVFSFFDASLPLLTLSALTPTLFVVNQHHDFGS